MSTSGFGKGRQVSWQKFSQFRYGVRNLAWQYEPHLRARVESRSVRIHVEVRARRNGHRFSENRHDSVFETLNLTIDIRGDLEKFAKFVSLCYCTINTITTAYNELAKKSVKLLSLDNFEAKKTFSMLYCVLLKIYDLYNSTKTLKTVMS